MKHKKLVSAKVSGHAIFQALNIVEKYCAALKNIGFSSVNNCYFASLTFRSHTMKKWLLGVVILLLSAMAFIYYYLPERWSLGGKALAGCTAEGAFRCLASEEKRAKWWPGGDTLQVDQILRNQLYVTIKCRGRSIPSYFMALPWPGDSSALEWEGAIESKWNPIKRVLAYQDAKEIDKRIHEILTAWRGFIEKPANIYGMVIKETSIKDTFLISTKANLKSYPATADIYELVDKLKDYSTHQNANVTGNPLLNIEKQVDSSYYVRVALPINKVLQNKKEISFIRMIPGRFLVADITGGPGMVAEARNQMRQYFQDYRRTSMAIPFQVLVTDRMKEPDTSKWVTRIYAPVY